MTKTAFVLLALAGLALALPGAEAQLTGYSIALSITPPQEETTRDASSTTTGEITFVSDATAPLLNPNGFSIQYYVTVAPTWLSATVSPATDILVVSPMPGPTVYAHRTFSLTMQALPNATEEQVGSIEVTAILTPTAPGMSSKQAKATIPVRLAASEPCDEHEQTAAGAPVATQDPKSGLDAGASAPVSDSPTPVKVQSASPAVAPASYLAVGGFAAAGAGVGFLLRRRL